MIKYLYGRQETIDLQEMWVVYESDTVNGYDRKCLLACFRVRQDATKFMEGRLARPTSIFLPTMAYEEN